MKKLTVEKIGVGLTSDLNVLWYACNRWSLRAATWIASRGN